jgi:hypothetical protein
MMDKSFIAGVQLFCNAGDIKGTRKQGTRKPYLIFNIQLSGRGIETNQAVISIEVPNSDI